MKILNVAVLSISLILQSAAPLWAANVLSGARIGSASQSAGAVVRPVSLGLGSQNLKPILLGSTLGTLNLLRLGTLTTGVARQAPGLQFVVVSAEVAKTLKNTAAAEATAGNPLTTAPATGISLKDSKRNAKGCCGKTTLTQRLAKLLRLGNITNIFDGSRSLSPAPTPDTSNGSGAAPNLLRSKGTGAATGRGILPEEGGSRSDVPLDSQPAQPGDTEVPRVTWDRVHFPGGTLAGAQQTESGIDSIQPITLPGDPQTADDVEYALRDLINGNASEFGGVLPEFLETTVAAKVEGREGLADSVYVSFRQKIQGVPVEGSTLNFTIKLIGGRAVVVASSAQLYPTLSLDAFGRLSDDQILEAAFERLGRPTGSTNDLQRVGRRIMHLQGRWRSAYLFYSESKILMAAVDVVTGESFAWDPRLTMSAGSVTGRGVEFDPANAAELDVMPMAHIELKASDGRTFHTDAAGFFTLEDSESAPVTLSARLKGRWATIEDQEKSNLTVSVTVSPGETILLQFNPEGADENAVAQVNAYRHATRVHDWVKSRGIDARGIDVSLKIKSNIGRDCNAYYTPWSPSLNFFQSSGRCINTAYDTVVYHEYGHFVDDVIGGIVNGALSEGWGDIIGMYMTEQPVLGEGFLKNQERHYIRHGENDYQFRSRDQVHKQGQAWMGFGWKLRRNLIATLGTERGTALADALVMPVLFANVRSIPAAIKAVLLRDVGENGLAAHFAEISAAARSHGIELKEPRPGTVESPTALRRRILFRWLADLGQSLMRAVRG